MLRKAYAKINLGLEVVSKREDNFHNLNTIMAMIDLYDELYFQKDSEITLETNINIGDIGNNLVYKAAVLLKNTFNVNDGCRIVLTKNIPMQSGLAGGSSDAAVTLEALNDLWKLNLSIDELANLGAKLGSDVPFCLFKKPAILEGRGDVLKQFIDLPEIYVVLVIPNFSCSTKDIFSNHVTSPNDNRFLKLINAIQSKDINNIGKRMFNDLEVTVDKIFSEEPIIKIKSKLLEFGASGAVMSGSGSTVYGITNSFKNAQKIKNLMKKEFKNYHIITTKTNNF